MEEIIILLAQWCVPGQELTDQDIDLHLAGRTTGETSKLCAYSLTPRGWNLFVQSVDRFDSMQMETSNVSSFGEITAPQSWPAPLKGGSRVMEAVS